MTESTGSSGFIFLIDDEENILTPLAAGLSEEGYRVQTFPSSKPALKALETQTPDVVITDIILPDFNGLELISRIKKISPELNTIVITAHASLDSAIHAIRLGAIDYLVKPFKLRDLLTAVQKATSQIRLLPDASNHQIWKNRYGFKNIIGQSSQMKNMYHLLSKMTKNDSTVLIVGESGTGKEMFARAIHYNSKRKNSAFISVNCAALPETLLESELFGYDKGAFTGAVSNKPGLFEAANSGTFFLDEIGEMPVGLQAKLLRVIQERTVQHLGGLREIPIDIRLIAATSKDLTKEMQEGKFRDDLFYRLNVVPIVLPPLRGRTEDIPLLIDYFLRQYTQKHCPGRKFAVSKPALRVLQEYAWPGNIRELENFVERLVTIEENDFVTSEAAAQLLGKKTSTSLPAVPTNNGEDLTRAVAGFEKKMIAEALKKTNGNKFKAAKALGLTRQNLRYKLKKYGIA